MATSIRVAHATPRPSFSQQAAQLIKQLLLFGKLLSIRRTLFSSRRPIFPHSACVQPCAHRPRTTISLSVWALESIYVDGPEVLAIRATTRGLGVMASIGISEKVRHGEVLVHHRKLAPTFAEKLTTAPGDGHGLRVAETQFGSVGGLICGENTNPLARFALMAQGEQIHISTWPAVWPTRVPQPPKTEEEEEEMVGSSVAQGANYDNVAANRTRAAAHCFEAKCLGVICAGVLGDDAVEVVAAGAGQEDVVKRALAESQRGATMFLDPAGALLRGFTVDESGEQRPTEFLQKEEEILYAYMDVGDCFEGKQYHDVVGGYQRLDVFELKVDRRRREPATFTGDVLTINTESEETVGSSGRKNIKDL